jgi:ArsR family transcriptional regulator
MAAALDIFKALADDVRLRILHALMTAELSVAELVTVMGLPQSTVSRHLKPLRDVSLVDTRREGTSVYYRRGAALADEDLGKGLERKLQDLPSAARDEKSIRRVLDDRRRKSRDFFEKVAGRYRSLTQPGGGWEGLAAALAAGFAGKVVADVGSGEGVLTLLLARFAREVVAVDQSPAMLREVKQEAKKAGLAERVRVEEGDLEALPLKDRSMDAVFLSQALHHAARPPAAVREAARVLRPDGLLIVLDLVQHEQEWVREKWADQWLGFQEDELKGWMSESGLTPLVFQRMEGATPELVVLLAVGKKTTSNVERRTLNVERG